jgi:hypothetical protein
MSVQSLTQISSRTFPGAWHRGEGPRRGERMASKSKAHPVLEATPTWSIGAILLAIGAVMLWPPDWFSLLSSEQQRSVSHAFLMDLVNRGKLVLDSPIRRYLPELPQSYEHVTSRYLVDHQSGVGGDENLTVRRTGIGSINHECDSTEGPDRVFAGVPAVLWFGGLVRSEQNSWIFPAIDRCWRSRSGGVYSYLRSTPLVSLDALGA